MARYIFAGLYKQLFEAQMSFLKSYVTPRPYIAKLLSRSSNFENIPFP